MNLENSNNYTRNENTSFDLNWAFILYTHMLSHDSRQPNFLSKIYLTTSKDTNGIWPKHFREKDYANKSNTIDFNLIWSAKMLRISRIWLSTLTLHYKFYIGCVSHMYVLTLCSCVLKLTSVPFALKWSNRVNKSWWKSRILLFPTSFIFIFDPPEKRHVIVECSLVNPTLDGFQNEEKFTIWC